MPVPVPVPVERLGINQAHNSVGGELPFDPRGWRDLLPWKGETGDGKERRMRSCLSGEGYKDTWREKKAKMPKGRRIKKFLRWLVRVFAFDFICFGKCIWVCMARIQTGVFSCCVHLVTTQVAMIFRFCIWLYMYFEIYLGLLILCTCCKERDKFPHAVYTAPSLS